jgi:hypothetical protein
MAHAFAIAFPKPFRIEVPIIAATTAVFAFLCEPMAAFVVLQHSDQINWVPRPTLADISEFLKLLTSQGGVLVVVLYLALCGLALVRVAGANRSYKESWALRLLVLWLVLLPLLTLAVTPIKPLFYPRYMVICVPAVVILAARGLTKLYQIAAVKHWAGIAAFVVVLSLSSWGTHEYFVNFPTETSDWRSAVSYILEHQKRGDGAVFFLPNAYCYQYYVNRAKRQHQVTMAPDVLYPPAVAHSLISADLRQQTSGRERVWFIRHIEVIDPQASAIIETTLSDRYRLVEKHQFPGEDLITVALYSAAPSDR